MISSGQTRQLSLRPRYSQKHMPVLEALISYAIFIAFLYIIIEIWGEGRDLFIHNLLPQLEPFFLPF